MYLVFCWRSHQSERIVFGEDYYPGVDSYELEITTYCADCDIEFTTETSAERGVWTVSCPACQTEIEGEE